MKLVKDCLQLLKAGEPYLALHDGNLILVEVESFWNGSTAQINIDLPDFFVMGSDLMFGAWNRAEYSTLQIVAHVDLKKMTFNTEGFE